MHAVAAPKAAKRWLPEWISDLLEKGLDVSVHETSEGRRKDLARGVHTGHGVDAAPRDTGREAGRRNSWHRDDTVVGEEYMVERTIGVHKDLPAMAANVFKLRHKLLEIRGWQVE